jgi:exodeoxyribonuclease-3
MKIASWNVNSIRARLDRVLAWLQKERPDVVCLQELKAVEQAFPAEALREAGYFSAVYGQKTYNGVAILSRTEPTAVERGMDDGVEDPQARLLAADVEGVRVLSAYVPNGQAVASEKYAYKLAWLGRLADLLARRYDPQERLVLCGDFNVARDDADVAKPPDWADTVLCHAAARAALESILDWGLTDPVRLKHPEGGIYSWWDYRMLAFPKNNGLRLDYVFATDPLAQRLITATVDRDERKGAKPSDHAPVIAAFEI